MHVTAVNNLRAPERPCRAAGTQTVRPVKACRRPGRGYDGALHAPRPMNPRPPPDPADALASPALGAFLRGVERRGLVFARLLAGSSDAGDLALAWTLERFAADAGRTAFGDWPRRFWSLLLAAPALRRPPASPRWEADVEWLSRIGHGPRAALLLRLVAGLAESDAAGVLGIARPTYRLGLQRALPHQPDGSADVEAWHALGRAAQGRVRALPPDPLARSALADGVPGGTASRVSTGRRPVGRGVRIALGLVALATLSGLVATFVFDDRLPDGLESAPDRVLSEPLPATGPEAGRYRAADALALHPDLAQLLDAAEDDAVAADPAFHAWLHTFGEPETEADDAGSVAAGIPALGAAAAIAARPEPSRRPATERLDALGPTARDRLEARRDQWDALSPAERGELRGRWLAWNDLPAGERARLREAAAVHARRTPDEQAALRARFDALDASDRHGWLLGPALGADYPRLHPLIAQVPADARAPLLDALRGLDAQARDDLAVLAARIPPQDRAELRVELLATPPEKRGRWLRTRVAPPR